MDRVLSIQRCKKKKNVNVVMFHFHVYYLMCFVKSSRRY
ncbi:unnamed protein product, partial [Arabidopsis halleri]